MFREKFIIEKGKVRTAEWIEIVNGIMLINKQLADGGNKKASKNTGLSIFAPQSLFISNQITKNLESLSELSDYISEGYNQNIFK